MNIDPICRVGNDFPIQTRRVDRKINELEKLFLNYDAGVRDMPGQIKPGLIEVGIETEVEKLERKAVRYDFDEALVISEKILQMLE